MGKNFFNEMLMKFEMKGIEKILGDEEIVDVVNGFGNILKKGSKNKDRSCVLVLTPTRVFLYNYVGLNSYFSVDFQLFRINNVELNKNIMYTEIKIHSVDDVIVLKRVDKKEGETFVNNLKEYISKSNINNSTVKYSIDIAEQLKKFSELKDQGILTEEEFITQKNKLLDL